MPTVAPAKRREFPLVLRTGGFPVPVQKLGDFPFTHTVDCQFEDTADQGDTLGNRFKVRPFESASLFHQSEPSRTHWDHRDVPFAGELPFSLVSFGTRKLFLRDSSCARLI